MKMLWILFLFLPSTMLCQQLQQLPIHRNTVRKHRMITMPPYSEYHVNLESEHASVVINSKVSKASRKWQTVSKTENGGTVDFLAHFQGNLNTWTIGVTEGGTEVNETLCYDPFRNETTAGDKSIFLTMISRSDVEIDISLTIHVNVDLVLKPGQEYYLTFTGLTPKVFIVMPVEDYSGEEYLLAALSEENTDNCFHVAINAFQCPWIDEETLVQNTDIHYRMIQKGYLSLVGPLLSEGFVLSIIPLKSSESCHSQKKEVSPSWPVTVRVILKENIVEITNPFLLALLLPVVVILVVIAIFSFSLYCIFKIKEMENYKGIMPNTELSSSAKSWNERQRSKAFMLLIPLIGGFYAILAVQLVSEDDKGIEECYKNYGCTIKGYIANFNHKLSNASFFLYGIAYIVLTSIMYRRCGNQFVKKNLNNGEERSENNIISTRSNTDREGNETSESRFGIFKQYSLYHALGLCLIFQGIFSIAFHMCPSDKSLQIDTLMMSFMLMLVFVKIHQLRHHDGAFNAYFIMWILLLPNLFIPLYLHQESYRITIYLVFCFIHLVTVSILIVDMYYANGQFQHISFYKQFLCKCLKTKTSDNALDQPNPSEHDSTNSNQQEFNIPCHYQLRRKYVFGVIGLIVFGSNVLIMYKLYPGEEEKGSSNMNELILFLYSVNLSIIMVYYMIAKLYSAWGRGLAGYRNRAEKLMFSTSAFYMITGFASCGLAAYYYTTKLKKRGLTPPESRNFNMPCNHLDYYDNHDMWHIFSSTGLFLGLMTILVIDDNLMLTGSREVEGQKNLFP